MATADKQITFNVVAATAAPAWWTSLADNGWAAVAIPGSSGHLDAVGVVPAPLPTTPPAADNAKNRVASWSGMAVDQARKELLLVANGGHGDYPGNEGYALTLTAATPAWRRLSDPTPNCTTGVGVSPPDTSHMPEAMIYPGSGYISPSFDEGWSYPATGPGVYWDGRPRAMHNSFTVYADGKVFSPFMNSVTSGGGGGVGRSIAYDRSYPGLPSIPGQAALPWTAANIGPWINYGLTVAQDGISFGGGGVFDRVNHMIYCLGGTQGSFGTFWTRTPTQGANIGQVTFFTDGSAFRSILGWVVCAWDLGIIVVGERTNDGGGNLLHQGICVLNISGSTLSNGQANNTWVNISGGSQTGTPYFSTGAGGAYIQQNHSIVIGDPFGAGGTFYQLQIPLIGAAYDPAGTWAWNSTNAPANTIDRITNQIWTRWNVVEDMGDQRAAIVAIGLEGSPTAPGPVRVYKIPRLGIPGSKGRYATAFPLNETSMSEGALWIRNPNPPQAGALPISPSQTEVIGGVHVCHGTQTSSSMPDAWTYINGFGTDYEVEGTIYKVAGGSGQFKEVEILLRYLDTYATYQGFYGPTNSKGYEINIAFDGSYANIGRIGDQNALISTSFAAPQNGQKFRARIVGQTITVWVNNIQILTTTDNSATKVTTGSPGIGFFVQNAPNNEFGFSNVTITAL